ncbi:FKBP-type peptidyl-prolyl cis-trans isomerase [Vibrio mangrovi]|uniref:Peptidyl-prolyl cis-trans isomerase n=1 Tax=Vibrio mangrovi TaxID=474394 RepID=A0A1Y6IWI4_9VIBR|nr:FKBP-type peptidyl-prolyl cis-trans isomerase [Vibrio mangrovi]MDW6005523.1 FKBP-type peptidyl-prolyl cis-trans isomerase [Vibrio mangrovi]SMS02035.1 FKBP-type 22 kDa peptidyl-prolyl cis-trans isomerase [Vibrio mangrovi]
MDKNYIFSIFMFIIAGIFLYRNWKRSQSASKNVSAGKAFLEQNAKEEGVITTESGLQYRVLQEGTGEQHPALSDKVKVHYHGTLLDGKVFDSSVNRNKPITFGVKQVIKGWQEGLQLMVVGQKVRLFVPASLAYGNRGIRTIPPGSLLIFDVELLDIQ